jgi:hypothetical protein
MNMSRSYKIALVIAILWFIARAVFAARPSVEAQTVLMILTFGFFFVGIISFVRALTQWRKGRFRAVAPLAGCILIVAVAPMAASAVRRSVFHQSLARYESVIRRIESGEIQLTNQLRNISPSESGLSHSVLAQREANGVFTVEFLSGSGFPVKHSGVLYCSSGFIEPGSVTASRWPKKVEMKPRWFRVSD